VVIASGGPSPATPLPGTQLLAADDVQRCLIWSTALAAPQPATSLTLLLAFLEAGRGTTAQRVLDNAGVTTHDLEPLEVAARGRQPAAKGLKRLMRRVPGLTHSPDLGPERIGVRLASSGFASR
jgi:hypothetical protein